MALSALALHLAVGLAHAAPTSSSAEPMAAPAPNVATRTDPSDPRAAVPPASYRSALEGAAPRPAEPVAWQAANDTVRRVGGWRAYLREAHSPRPAAAPASGAGR